MRIVTPVIRPIARDAAGKVVSSEAGQALSQRRKIMDGGRHCAPKKIMSNFIKHIIETPVENVGANTESVQDILHRKIKKVIEEIDDAELLLDYAKFLAEYTIPKPKAVEESKPPVIGNPELERELSIEEQMQQRRKYAERTDS